MTGGLVYQGQKHRSFKGKIFLETGGQEGAGYSLWTENRSRLNNSC
jgi:hypothetical protein